MLLIAKVLTSIVLLIHIYIVLIETLLFEKRGRKAFGLNAEQAAQMKAVMSNQGCYNGFLVAALALGLFWPDPAIARAFTLYGLSCVAIAGIWGAVTAQIRILYIQTLPAALALAAWLVAA